MFTTARVGCYLNGFSGHGDDPDNKELKLVFHVSPITHDLASEIHSHLADRLFRKDISEATGNLEWMPVREMPKASFASIAIHMQNVTFNDLPEAGSEGVIVPGASITNLRAARASSDGFDFRLEFDAVVPMDESTMDLVEKFYKSTCFLTMEPVQREMEYEPDAEQQALQEAAESGEVAPKKKRGRPKKSEETVIVEVV
jgi:hypothetical protein